MRLREGGRGVVLERVRCGVRGLLLLVGSGSLLRVALPHVLLSSVGYVLHFVDISCGLLNNRNELQLDGLVFGRHGGVLQQVDALGRPVIVKNHSAHLLKRQQL